MKFKKRIGIFIHTLPLKLTALLAGSCTWYLLSQWLPAFKTMEIPVAVYGSCQDQVSLSHTQVKISVSGPRKIIRAVTPQEVAVHLNSAQLSPGKQTITIEPDLLLLPRQIKITSAEPAHIIATLS